MTVTFGYTIFYVPDVAAALDFHQRAFGLQTRLATPEGDYGELETGATTLAFVADGLAEANLDAAGGYTPLDPTTPPVGATITVLTDDVPGTLDAAVAAGGRRYVEPVDKPWGQTVAYLVDPNGILIEIATPVGA